MNKFETVRLRLKIGFVVLAFVLLVGLPLLTPHIKIWGMGRIPLSPFQILYATLSLEIALAVYVWGVGNWSRFEPPQASSGSSAPPSGVAQVPPPGTPPTQQGGN